MSAFGLMNETNIPQTRDNDYYLATYAMGKFPKQIRSMSDEQLAQFIENTKAKFPDAEDQVGLERFIRVVKSGVRLWSCGH
jgi:hypothetical protein